MPRSRVMRLGGLAADVIDIEETAPGQYAMVPRRRAKVRGKRKRAAISRCVAVRGIGSDGRTCTCARKGPPEAATRSFEELCAEKGLVVRVGQQLRGLTMALAKSSYSPPRRKRHHGLRGLADLKAMFKGDKLKERGIRLGSAVGAGVVIPMVWKPITKALTDADGKEMLGGYVPPLAAIALGYLVDEFGGRVSKPAATAVSTVLYLLGGIALGRKFYPALEQPSLGTLTVTPVDQLALARLRQRMLTGGQRRGVAGMSIGPAGALPAPAPAPASVRTYGTTVAHAQRKI